MKRWELPAGQQRNSHSARRKVFGKMENQAMFFKPEKAIRCQKKRTKGISIQSSPIRSQHSFCIEAYGKENHRNRSRGTRLASFPSLGNTRGAYELHGIATLKTVLALKFRDFHSVWCKLFFARRCCRCCCGMGAVLWGANNGLWLNNLTDQSRTEPHPSFLHSKQLPNSLNKQRVQILVRCLNRAFY